MKTYFKVVALLVALFMAGLVGRAAEAARMQNYDQWKDLPTMTLVDKGNEFWRIGKVDSALLCSVILSYRFDEKLPVKEKKICCGAFVGAGKLYMHFFNDYQTSYRYLLKAEQIAEKNHFEYQLAEANEAMAVLSIDRLDMISNYSYHAETIELFKKVFYQAVKSHHYVTACFTFGNLVFFAMKHNHVSDIDSELKAFHSLEIPDRITYKSHFKTLCEGALAYKSGLYSKALTIASQSEALLPHNGNPQAIARERSMTCIFRYAALRALHRDDEALQELDKAEQIARDYQLEDAVVEYLRLKQEYYENHGNEALAKEYKLKYFEAKDEFINRSKLLSVEQQKFLIELEEMGEEVKDLEAQKRMRDLVIAGVAIFALMVIGALIFLWRNYLNTRQRNLILYQKNQELLALEQERNMPVEKYKSSPMDEQAKDELLQRIYAAMESHQEIYDEGFTLDQLARLVGDNPNYVSQVINEKKGCNFKAFVNDYKIKEACRRLSDKQQYGGLTIEAIGQSVGFKSRTHFYATFKQFTGMTPAAYQRAAREESDSPDANAENKSV